MSRSKEDQSAPEMLPEYDFSEGVRGKYARRYGEGNNLVMIAPDLVETFPTSEAVNAALRRLVDQEKA